jgi:hypothetical protein
MATPIHPPIPIPTSISIPTPTLELPQIPQIQYIKVPTRPQKELPTPEPKIEKRKPLEAESLLPPKEVPINIQDVQDLIERNLKEVIQEKPVSPPIPRIDPTVNKITIPILNAELPIPSKEVITTATFTAGAASVASVAGTLAATAIFKRVVQILKPAFTFVLKKTAHLHGKKQETYGRRRLRQRLNRLNKTET